MVLWCSPELNERGDEFAFITLGAYMSQADNEVVLKQTLDDNIAIYSCKIEVDSKLVDHF